MSIALRTLEFLSSDSDYVPWRAMVGELSYLDLMLSRTAIYGEFEVCHVHLSEDMKPHIIMSRAVPETDTETSFAFYFVRQF